MSNPFQNFHSLFIADPEGRVADESLRLLFTAREIELLNAAKALARTETAASMPCPNCDDGHFSEIQRDAEGKPFVSCTFEPGPAYYLNEADTSMWRLDVPSLLRLVAEKLDIETAVREVVAGDLWTVGVRRAPGASPVAILFSRTGDLDKLFDKIDERPLGYANTIVFTPTGGPVPSGHFHIRATKLDDHLAMRTRGIGGDATKLDELISITFRMVVFTEGDIIVDGQVIGSLAYGSAEYWFFDYLMKHFGVAVPQVDVQRYCAKQRGRDDYAKSAEAFCAEMKSNIKKKCGKNPKVDKMIISGTFGSAKKGVKIVDPR